MEKLKAFLIAAAMVFLSSLGIGCGISVTQQKFTLQDNVPREALHLRTTNEVGTQQSVLASYICPTAEKIAKGEMCKPEFIKPAEGVGVTTELIRGPGSTAPFGMFNYLFYRPTRMNFQANPNVSSNSSPSLTSNPTLTSNPSLTAIQDANPFVFQFSNQSQTGLFNQRLFTILGY